MLWSEPLVISFFCCTLCSWPASRSFLMCVSVCVLVSSFSLHLLLLVWFDLRLLSFLSCISWSWPAASSFFNQLPFNHMISRLPLHLLLLLWFGLKLLSSHSCLVFCGAGLRPVPFLITCVSLSVYLSRASLYICCFSRGLVWRSWHPILVLCFVELACGQLLF